MCGRLRLFKRAFSPGETWENAMTGPRTLPYLAGIDYLPVVLVEEEQLAMVAEIRMAFI